MFICIFIWTMLLCTRKRIHYCRSKSCFKLRPYDHGDVHGSVTERPPLEFSSMQSLLRQRDCPDLRRTWSFRSSLLAWLNTFQAILRIWLILVDISRLASHRQTLSYTKYHNSSVQTPMMATIEGQCALFLDTLPSVLNENGMKMCVVCFRT